MRNGFYGKYKNLIFFFSTFLNYSAAFSYYDSKYMLFILLCYSIDFTEIMEIDVLAAAGQNKFSKTKSCKSVFVTH